MEEQKNNTGDEQTPESAQDTPERVSKEKNTGMAVVAYILFFVPLLTDEKDDPFVLYHVRQGFVLLVAFIITGFITIIPSPLMVVGMFIQLALAVLGLLGIINALGGKEEPLPVIGQFADKAPF